MNSAAPSFIEAKRKGGSNIRVRADLISALIPVEIKEGDKYKHPIRLHLGTNNYVDVENETLDTVWNKMCQALGKNLVLIGCVTEDYPGHPDYGKTKEQLAAERAAKATASSRMRIA